MLLLRSLAIFALIGAVFVGANPAANAKWHWKPRTLKVTPNPRYHRPVFAAPAPQKPAVTGFRSEAASCGKTPSSLGIVGGNEAVPHSFPWQVALFIDDAYFCGGSIITNDYILTAAHCVDGSQRAEVVAGAHDISTDEPSQFSQNSTVFIVHAEWDPKTVANDIALIKLSKPLTYNEFISPVCLPAHGSHELAAGTELVATGWGRRSDTVDGISRTLYQVTSPVDTNTYCQSVYGSIITDNILCTNTNGGKGTCSGDSGGPLNYVNGGKTYTRGVTSFVAQAGCESGLPDGFTRVINYLSWIEENSGMALTNL